MPVALQARIKTKAASLCCTPENIRASSTPDGYRVTAINPDAVPFYPDDYTLHVCDESLLSVKDIADSPEKIQIRTAQ